MWKYSANIVGVIHEYFPSLVDKISKDKMKRPWKNKIYINSEFEELGITIEKNLNFQIY